MPKRSGTADWYINAALAGVTALLIAVAFVINIVTLARGPVAVLPTSLEGSGATVAGFVVLVLVPAIFWFWGRMLHDYFKNRPTKRPVAWGWALFLLNVGAAVAYYWFVWRPRNDARSGSAA